MNNIYVGNLDSAATEETIRCLFAPHGKVERVKLMTDRHTGSFRGFAFVVMAGVFSRGIQWMVASVPDHFWDKFL